MSNTATFSNDDLNDLAQVDSCVDAGPALLEPNDGAAGLAPEWSGPRCDKCDAPLASGVVSICRRCGWYASLGAFLEVDANWEAATEQEQTSAAEKPQLSHIGVWLAMIPRWAWVIIASVVLVIIESVVARFATADGSEIQTMWSLGQITFGLLAVAGCHIFNFLVLAADDAEIGLLDLLLKPLKLWIRAVHNLPTRLWMVDAAACGIVAAVMSVLVIGGIPYERFWDWGFKEPPKQDLMGAVMNRVKQLDSGEGDGDLQKSISDFAGDKNLEPNDKPKPAPPKPKLHSDCVILGYHLNSDGLVSTLLLGTANKGQLVYAGSVRPKLSDDESRELTKMLESIQSGKPFIKVQLDATWVEAKYTCRVNYAKRTKDGRLQDIEWDKLLGRIEQRK